MHVIILWANHEGMATYHQTLARHSQSFLVQWPVREWLIDYFTHYAKVNNHVINYRPSSVDMQWSSIIMKEGKTVSSVTVFPCFQSNVSCSRVWSASPDYLLWSHKESKKSSSRAQAAHKKPKPHTACKLSAARKVVPNRQSHHRLQLKRTLTKLRKYSLTHWAHILTPMTGHMT